MKFDSYKATKTSKTNFLVIHLKFKNRNRLNELKKTKDHSSDRDQATSYETRDQYKSSYHRTKQVHDYEPYHKSSVTTTTTTTTSSYSRSGSSHSHRAESRPKNYSSEKGKF